jgi:hypothetical protein
MSPLKINALQAKNTLELFHFDKHRHGFEDFSCQDGVGIRYWRARDFMKMLGYDDYPLFDTIVRKSCDLCNRLEIDETRNFQVRGYGQESFDYQLSKFACYLVAMNCDTNKKEVEKAQSYFKTIAESFYRYICKLDSKTVADSENYQFFKNKKNLALFNMSYITDRSIRFGEF